MVSLYIGSFRSLFVSFPISFCFRSSALHPSISSFTLGFYHRMTPHLLHPRHLYARRHALSHDSVKFHLPDIAAPRRHRRAGLSPAGPPSRSFFSPFPSNSPCATRRVLVSCYPGLTYMNPCNLPFKGRRLWPLSFYFCVLLLLPDRLTTNRSTLPSVAPLVLCFFVFLSPFSLTLADHLTPPHRLLHLRLAPLALLSPHIAQHFLSRAVARPASRPLLLKNYFRTHELGFYRLSSLHRWLVRLHSRDLFTLRSNICRDICVRWPILL